MSDREVLASQDGSVLTLTLNRPDKLNAWTREMGNLYFDLLDEADRSPDVRVIVVTGAGRGFCAGLDGALLSKSAGEGDRQLPAGNRRQSHAMSIRKPVIGAINGPAAGFGLVQALYFDIRIAGESAMFTTAFVQRGLNAEYGASWLLPRIIGQGRAMDLIMSGRRVYADEAERIGLVSRVVPDADLLAEAQAYARNIAEIASPVALADSKFQVYNDWNCDRITAEDRAKAVGHFSPAHRVDYKEGVASMREKRKPAFAPLPSDRDGSEALFNV